jgi:hypothetical protein
MSHERARVDVPERHNEHGSAETPRPTFERRRLENFSFVPTRGQVNWKRVFTANVDAIASSREPHHAQAQLAGFLEDLLYASVEPTGTSRTIDEHNTIQHRVAIE